MPSGADWDVAVVGGGPAGLSAGWAAARAGARTVVIERARHPRYKTCGGGLVAVSAWAAAARTTVPARDRVHAVTFTHDGARAFTRRDRQPLLTMVRREEFDDALRRAAVAAGAVMRERCVARGVREADDRVYVRLADGSEVSAGCLVGADGSAGVTARYVGGRYRQVDVGLELELRAGAAERERWRGRLLIDWGPIPGAYGWVFPKDDQLTVGVIAARERGDEARRYLERFVDRLGLASAEVLRDSGHLTRCRAEDSPLYRGRVVLAGDAAGLLEPWTREGISYALRSGALAGEAAAAAARTPGDPASALERYRTAVAGLLGGEMDAGRRLLAAFERHPGVFHAALATPPGWRAFRRFCRGEVTFAPLLARAPIGRLVSALTRW